MIQMSAGIGMRAALRRLGSIPGWVVGVWLTQVALAAGVGAIVKTTVAAAMAGDHIEPGGRWLYALADLGLDHPAIAAAAAAAIGVSAVAGLLAWTLVVGLLLARLRSNASTGAVLQTWWKTLPGIGAQSAWHVVMRGVMLLAALSTASALPPVAGWPLVWLVWSIGVVGLDVARTRVVDGAPPLHPRTAALAIVDVVRHPARYGPAVALAAIGTLVPLVLVWLGLSQLGGALAPTGARAVALAGVALGLWRLALVVLRTDASVRAADD